MGGKGKERGHKRGLNEWAKKKGVGEGSVKMFKFDDTSPF